MTIKHDNIFYVFNIAQIGGVETYLYELCKKYKNLDIAVVCKIIDPVQRARLKQFCNVYVHNNERIECKVIITNFDTSILDYVNEDAKKYTVLHTDYSHDTQRGGIPEDREDITYIGITDYSLKAFQKITGITDRTILCRNPYELELDKKPLILVSCTRLTEAKGGRNMLHLANTLQNMGVNFLWFVITSDEYENDPIWENQNVVHVPSRLNVGGYIRLADWYVLLSKVEGDSYSFKEALYRGVPIVACELPYFKEYGIKDNVNALFYKPDDSNAVDVAKRMLKPLKFTFNPIQDGYDKILAKGKSHYEEDRKKRFKVRDLGVYKRLHMIDGQLGRTPEPGEEWIVDSDRLQNLLGDNRFHRQYCELVEEVNQNT